MTTEKTIEKLTEIRNTTGEYATKNKLTMLIDELKIDMIKHGFKGGEAERYKVSLRFQKMMYNKGRPVLALWHKNEEDGKYYFTNSAIMVRVSEEDFLKDLHTTTDTFEIYDKHGYVSYSWKGEANLYPNVNECWVDGTSHEEINIDMPEFMAWLRANKHEQFGEIIINKKSITTTIHFDIGLITSALIMSKVAQEKGYVTLKYMGEYKVFQFGDNCLCTPVRSCTEEHAKYIIVRR